MRPFYFLLFLLFAQKITVAQNQYIPMVKEGKYWFISAKDIVTQKDVYYFHTFNGDTVVNNLVYKKLIRYNIKGQDIPVITTSQRIEALVREDTAARMVYQILTYPILPTCVSEHVMYDFSLDVGDTLDDCMLAIWKSAMLPSRTIDSIHFKTIGNRYRRGLAYTAWTLEDFLLILQPFNYYEGYGYQSSGVMLRGASCYKFCEGSLTDCNIILANNDLDVRFGLSLYPNPMSGNSSNLLKVNYSLPSSAHADNLDLCVTDLQGMIKEMQPIAKSGDATIDLTSLSNGVYLIQLRSEGVVLAVEKLVVVR